jgi:signal transduction histidine kinase
VRVSVAAADARARPAVAELEALPLEAYAAVLQELASGESPLCVQANGAAGAPRTPALSRLVEVAEAASLLGIPLAARGKVLGAFLFLSTGAGRPRDEADLRFATELSRLAALAIDNAQLYRAARDATRARDDVLGIVAHDLRAPLHGVALHVSKLRHDLGARGLADLVAAPARSIEAAVARMDRLIGDLLDVTRMDAGRLEIELAPVAARDLLEKAVEGAAGGGDGCRVRMVVAGGLPAVSADEGRILQVLSNLIDNALKFTSQGTEVAVGAEPRGRFVCFRVGDRGPGIPAGQLPHVFERFWRADPRDRRGAGLGLSIAKGIIELHGGQLWVESAVGQGTTFFFTLPVAGA